MHYVQYAAEITREVSLAAFSYVYFFHKCYGGCGVVMETNAAQNRIQLVLNSNETNTLLIHDWMKNTLLFFSLRLLTTNVNRGIGLHQSWIHVQLSRQTSVVIKIAYIWLLSLFTAVNWNIDQLIVFAKR